MENSHPLFKRRLTYFLITAFFLVGTVCAVLQKGYTMGKSVLRYAMVKVVPE